MKAERITFRVQTWLTELLDRRADTHPHETRTEAIHNLIAELLKEVKTLRADNECFRLFIKEKHPQVTREPIELNCSVFPEEKVSMEQCKICLERKLVPQCPKLKKP